MSIAPKSLKLVTCHLGNGCSVAAIHEGCSLDRNMGFTPLDGLMIGTRSGSVDPGIRTYLMRQRKLDGQEIDTVLNQKSGLLGISGLSSDMRDILAAIRQGYERAKLAFDIYVHRLRAAIGVMAAVLGGVDALVFTAGVGENSPRFEPRPASDWNFSASDSTANECTTFCRPRYRNARFACARPGDSGGRRLGGRSRVLQAGARSHTSGEKKLN